MQESADLTQSSDQSRPLLSSTVTCFVPGGNWDKTAIPIYNPNNMQKQVRVLINQGSGSVISSDIYVGPHTFTTFNSQNGYALVDEF